MQDNKAKLIGLVVIALLAVAGTGAVVMLNNRELTNQTSEAQDSTTTTEHANAKSTENTDNSYKDGTYDADGSYRTPGGTEKVSVKVTLVDSTITAVEVTGSGSGESAQYQELFKDGISDVVVGKNINEIQVSRVSGSSLTSTGFNNAIETIKQEATTSA